MTACDLDKHYDPVVSCSRIVTHTAVFFEGRKRSSAIRPSSVYLYNVTGDFQDCNWFVANLFVVSIGLLLLVAPMVALVVAPYFVGLLVLALPAPSLRGLAAPDTTNL